MLSKQYITNLLVSTILVVGTLFPVYAQSTTPAQNLKAGCGSMPKDQQITCIKSRADQEIDRRVASLNKLISKVNEVKKVSDSQKNTFIAQIQSEISSLNALKSKIDADTDVSILRTDSKSIFGSYRIYLLFIPRTNILVAADRMSQIADDMSQLVQKLQVRIQQAQSQGKDVSAMQASLTDMQAKLADAKTQYQNAENLVTSLVPDQGNKTNLTSNNTAIQNAKTDIKTGAQDLKAARDDAESIVRSLKSITGKSSQ